jgi:hypothetical protein
LSTLRISGAALRLAESPFFALLLSAIYPAVFLLSLNWYSLKTDKIVFALFAPAIAAMIAYLLARVVVWSVFAGLRPLLAPGKRAELRSFAVVLLMPLVCSVVFFFFMYGTLQKLLPSNLLLLLGFLALTALLLSLGIYHRLRYWTAALAIMTLSSLVTWAHSVAAATTEAAAEQNRLLSSPLSVVKFKSRPNIYLIVYDAYGNRRLHSEVFNVDNTAIYQELTARQFKVLDTYSNYWGTWETMLSIFLADHHYYELMAGVSDSRIGRSIMNGTASNPVLSVLKSNGYKVQYIEATDYLVKDQGNLDYDYPGGREPMFSGLRIFNNPFFDLLPFVKVAGAKPQTLEGYVNTMTDVLFKRLDETSKGKAPWFTYIHFPLPAHAMGPFRSLRSWEDVYRENTRKANSHMPPTIDRILEIDPDALIVIMGDHGSYRYSEAWKGAADPNEAFRKNGLDSNLLAVDYFGIMMAMRSRGQCDELMYQNMTPANLMRVIFSCLSGDRKLLDGKVADISIFPDESVTPPGLYLAVKEGAILKPWIKISR